MHSAATTINDPIFGVEMTSITTVTPRSVVGAGGGNDVVSAMHQSTHNRSIQQGDGGMRQLFPTAAIEADMMSPETEIDSNKTTAPVTPAAATSLERFAPTLRPSTPPPLKPLHQHQPHLQPNHRHGSIETLEGAHVFVCEGRWLKSVHQPTSPVSDNVEHCAHPHKDNCGVGLVSLCFDGDEALRIAPPFQHDDHRGPLPQYGGLPLRCIPFSEIVDVRRLSSVGANKQHATTQFSTGITTSCNASVILPDVAANNGGENENEDPVVVKFFNGAVECCQRAMQDTTLGSNGAKEYLSLLPFPFTRLHLIEVHLQQPHGSPTRRQSMSLQDFCNLKLGEAAAEVDFPSSCRSLQDDVTQRSYPQAALLPPRQHHGSEGLTLSSLHSRFSGLSTPTTSSDPCGLGALSSIIFATGVDTVADSLTEFIYEVAASNPTRCLLPNL